GIPDSTGEVGRTRGIPRRSAPRDDRSCRRGATATRSLLFEQDLVLAVALFLEVLDRDEAHRGGVHAVAQVRGRRAVVEDVAQVRIRLGRAHLGPLSDEGQALAGLDVALFERLPEARPARARVVLLER